MVVRALLFCLKATYGQKILKSNDRIVREQISYAIRQLLTIVYCDRNKLKFIRFKEWKGYKRIQKAKVNTRNLSYL